MLKLLYSSTQALAECGQTASSQPVRLTKKLRFGLHWTDEDSMLLSDIARQFFVIPASSIGCEHYFSASNACHVILRNAPGNCASYKNNLINFFDFN